MNLTSELLRQQIKEEIDKLNNMYRLISWNFFNAKKCIEIEKSRDIIVTRCTRCKMMTSLI